MSDMLEQAIVDADALKEAALKNAETAVLEKYSGEIKTALNRLLEQPLLPGDPDEPLPGEEGEEPLDLGAEGPMDDPLAAPDLDLGLEETTEPVEDEFPNLKMTHTDGTDICIGGCPDEEQMVEIDLDRLAEALNLKDEELTEDEEIDLEESEDEEIDLEESEEDKVDLTEEELASIFEKLKVDAKNVPTGQPGGGSNETLDRDNEEVALSEDEEELEEDEEKEKLEELVKKLQKDKKSLSKKSKEYKNMLMMLKEKLDEVNLSNARLLYTNRVLGSTSLNERQKNNIVEALSKADSVEGAKVIYDTLQSAVGSSRKRPPKSLSEAVKKNSSTILSSRKDEKQYNSVSNRWKTLAGIK